MACRVPVVGTKPGEAEHIVEQGVNGYLAGTTQEWVESLETLLQDESLRRKIGENGRRTVEEKFDSERMVDTFERLLELKRN